MHAGHLCLRQCRKFHILFQLKNFISGSLEHSELTIIIVMEEIWAWGTQVYFEMHSVLQYKCCTDLIIEILNSYTTAIYQLLLTFAI